MLAVLPKQKWYMLCRNMEGDITVMHLLVPASVTAVCGCIVLFMKTALVAEIRRSQNNACPSVVL